MSFDMQKSSSCSTVSSLSQPECKSRSFLTAQFTYLITRRLRRRV